jgi:sigma-B regulation protein RsbU (phosphoserine phosphatase)
MLEPVIKKVLVVEDDPASCKILETVIAKWGYEVITASDGSEAWEIFRANSDIHIIVSDWMMPGFDGVELCRLVRALEGRRYTYFILLTAKSQIDDVISGLEAGADDFVTKPFNQYELRVRIRGGERVVDLENQLANKVDELSAAYNQMRKDLTAAATMQRSMLPPQSGIVKGLRYASSFIPSEEIGGDLFNVIALGETKIGVFIFDVSGHGVPAALSSVAMGRMLMPYIPNASILLDPSTKKNMIDVVEPSEVVNRLNERFQSASSKGDFITFLYGVVDTEARTFTYSRAGHPAPLKISQGSLIEIEDKGDIPIGIIPDYKYMQVSIDLAPGDRLFFFTDGIPEASSPDGERYSEDRMIDALAGSYKLSIRESIGGLIASLIEWQGKTAGDDDMTILGIELTA